MQDAVTAPHSSYLQQLGSESLDQLRASLTPELRERLARHMLQVSATPAADVGRRADDRPREPPRKCGEPVSSAAASSSSSSSGVPTAAARQASKPRLPRGADGAAGTPCCSRGAVVLPPTPTDALPPTLGSATPLAPPHPAACVDGSHGGPDGDDGFNATALGPPHAALFTAQQMQTLLPALAPEAQRWLNAMENASRVQQRQQQSLQALGRHAWQSEQLRSDADEEKRRLRKLVQQQSAALATSTRHMQTLRVAHDRKAAELEAQAERVRQLERGLRAAVRHGSTS